MFKGLVFALSLMQVIGVTFKPNTPVTIAFEHDNNDGVGGFPSYRIYCNDAIIKNWSKAEADAGRSAIRDANGNYTYTLVFTAPSKVGTYTCQVTSYSDANVESARSNDLKTPVGNAIQTPLNFRFVITIAK